MSGADDLDIADPAARKALGAAIAAMRENKDNEYEMLKALLDGATALEPFNEPAAIEHLVVMATDMFGVNPDLAQRIIQQGYNIAVEQRAKRNAKGNGKEQPEEKEKADKDDPGELGEWDAGDDPGFIPPREWLLANQFCLSFISSIVAAGGTGKSALRLVQFISLAIGRSLCGQHVFKRCRVLLISLEDDVNELQRHIKAALDHFHIDRSELKGWLFCASPKLAKLAVRGNNKTRIAGPLEHQLRAAIARRKPDLISLDPFIKTHALEENDSGDMDFEGILVS
jgi:hypothetical protein